MTTIESACLTCKHNAHADCVDAELLGVDGKEGEDGGERREEEEEVRLDREEGGVDVEHHPVRNN